MPPGPPVPNTTLTALNRANRCFAAGAGVEVQGQRPDGAARPLRSAVSSDTTCHGSNRGTPRRDDLPRERVHHLLRGPRARRRGAAALVVVRAVAGVPAEAVVRKRHAELDEAVERLGRVLRLAERDVAVHAAAREEVLGQQPRRVGHPAVEGELVVGLLVRARVGGRPAAPALGDDGDVVLAEVSEPDCRGERRGTGPDDERVDAVHRHRDARHRHPVFSHARLLAESIASRCREE